MRITIAMRVIGGFIIITALLFVISVSSFFSLKGVGSSNEQVNEIAIPSLVGVGNVETGVLQISTTQLESFYAMTLSEVESSKQKYLSFKELLDKDQARLVSILTQSGQRTNIQEVIDRVERFSSTALAIIDAQAEYLELVQQSKNRINDVEIHADDAAMLILDLTDRADISDELLDIAADLEAALNGLITLGYDILNVEDINRADIIRSEIEVAIDTLEGSFQSLKQAAGNNPYVPEIQDRIQDAHHALIGSNSSLVESSIYGLELRAKSQEFIDQNTERMDTLLVNMNQLQAQVQTLAQTIRQEAHSSITRSSWLNTVLTLISIVLASVISFLTVRAITIPLNRVNAILNTLADGDLSRKLDDRGSDEFGVLAKNTNLLIDNLRSLIEGISNRATQLATAAEESSSVSADSMDAIQEQRSQVEQVAAATQEMTSTSSEVAQAAADSLRQIQHSDEEATRVKTISDENRRTIESLAVEIQNAAEVINQLSENSSSIGGILDVIRGIADQTNLLALNAAIEAARAGEQGRGFAVVADEVRTLASRTQQSTEEIQSMIESLQTDSERAVEVMQRGRQQAEISVTQTEEQAAALEEITSAVHLASDSSTHIATAAEQQSATSREISEKLEEIVSIAERAEAGALQTDQASAEVARLAAEMQESIRRFQL